MRDRYLVTIVDLDDGARVETHLRADDRIALVVVSRRGAVLTPDDAVRVATGLVERALPRCSPELRERFTRLVRDVQR